jgi:glycosyltransferase involved in cell wall biosynthesis
MMSALPTNHLQSARRRQYRPLVTIITVVYNAVDVLAATIESVISQTYPHIEYIIIDGGSTDGTYDVIQHYSAAIAILKHEADQGIYDAMNKGVQLANGEIIGLLNAGDCYRPEAVAAVVDAYQNSIPLDDSDCVLIAASLEVITNSGWHYLKRPISGRWIGIFLYPILRCLLPKLFSIDLVFFIPTMLLLVITTLYCAPIGTAKSYSWPKLPPLWLLLANQEIIG